MYMNYHQLPHIESQRLILVNCTEELLELLMSGGPAITHRWGIHIVPNWTEFGEQALRYTYNKITKDSAEAIWWTWLPVLKNSDILVGTCGYKGAPQNGVVEIGYETATDYRRQGLATEIASTLISNAFTHPSVSTVQAHTLGEINESGRVLEKCGMKMVEEIVDPEDGKLWRWEVRK
jgi:[ribosomal protein S5]-alanine N-acetyltransferase